MDEEAGLGEGARWMDRPSIMANPFGVALLVELEKAR